MTNGVDTFLDRLGGPALLAWHRERGVDLGAEAYLGLYRDRLVRGLGNTLLIYLDTNFWVRLRDAARGTGSAEAVRLLQTLRAMVRQREALCVSQIYSLLEVGKFYSLSATPILVKCEWHKSLPMDKLIPLSIAMPLLLEQEVPCWEWAQVAETWESMRPYFLGAPRGARSSLFVSQETGQAIKKVWEALIYTGMFGPIKV